MFNGTNNSKGNDRNPGDSIANANLMTAVFLCLHVVVLLLFFFVLWWGLFVFVVVVVVMLLWVLWVFLHCVNKIHFKS